MTIYSSPYISARSCAFFALQEAENETSYIFDALEKYKNKLSQQDLALAYELACGAMRYRRYLDFIATKLSKNAKLPAKKKERLLLRLTLYQCYFLKRMPAHAIGSEMGKLAKLYTSGAFSSYLNALIRTLKRDQLPETQNLALLFSYPDFYVETIQKRYGDKTREILEQQNLAPHSTCRQRAKTLNAKAEEDMLKLETLGPELLSSSDYYIQNSTQPKIMQTLFRAHPLQAPPKKILDLCAAPGGKTLLLHDLFPSAKLFANDVSEARIARLKENLDKYSLACTLSSSDGKNHAFGECFDLICVDAPCSNSGVLYKCPEARWRITQENVQALQNEALSLLENAKRHLLPHGTILYMTCSILPQENEEVISLCKEKLGLTCLTSYLQLPNRDGYEGGFGALFSLAPS
jgi:16S rRNA (cytosine967-C5)-methyltransferase